MRQKYDGAMLQSGVLENSSDPRAWQRLRELLGKPPLPQINYASDKGWRLALERFCGSVADGSTPLNANAADAYRATACAIAARESIRDNQVVHISPNDWLLTG
jgi:hypothetical protein